MNHQTQSAKVTDAVWRRSKDIWILNVETGLGRRWWAHIEPIIPELDRKPWRPDFCTVVTAIILGTVAGLWLARCL